jgi:two-component system, chemotaxis family, chemotaxis protein CheY
MLFIIDDDADISETVSDLLREEGYAVESYTDVRAALRRLEAGVRPTMILLDLGMPESGEIFFDRVENAGLGVKVVLTSASQQRALEVFAARATATLRKPFDLGDLLETVEQLSAGGPGE